MARSISRPLTREQARELSFLIRLPDEHVDAHVGFDVFADNVPGVENGACWLSLRMFLRGAKAMRVLAITTVDATKSQSQCVRDGQLLQGLYLAKVLADEHEVMSYTFTVR